LDLPPHWVLVGVIREQDYRLHCNELEWSGQLWYWYLFIFGFGFFPSMSDPDGAKLESSML
jgi:hypothetical protein